MYSVVGNGHMCSGVANGRRCFEGVIARMLADCMFCMELILALLFEGCSLCREWIGRVFFCLLLVEGAV